MRIRVQRGHLSRPASQEGEVGGFEPGSIWLQTLCSVPSAGAVNDMPQSCPQGEEVAVCGALFLGARGGKKQISKVNVCTVSGQRSSQRGRSWALRVFASS